MGAQRFYALDGLRGVAAIMVLCFHIFFFEPGRPFAHGYLSVDLFFVLSGFVLAYAFGPKLDSGMSPVRFILARIRRLWPVLVLGAIAAVICTEVAKNFGEAGQSTSVSLVIDFLRDIFLIPHTGPGGSDAFPINPPMWSLFAEFWTNVAFAFVAPWLDRRRLFVVVGLGWLFMIVHSFFNGSSDFGNSTSTIIAAIPRGMSSFACGVLIFRLWSEGALARLPSVNPVFVFAIWVAISLVPVGRYGAVFDLLQIIISAPVMIALLARYEGRTPEWAIFLGRISYPLYATHSAVVNSVQRVAMMHGEISHALEAILFAVSISLAFAVSRWYEPAVAMLWRRRTALSDPASG